jgi:hypothetical protein
MQTGRGGLLVIIFDIRMLTARAALVVSMPTNSRVESLGVKL